VREAVLKTVALYERDIYVCNFLRLPGDQASSDLAERLTELRRYEFAARYGDYLSHVCEKVKAKASENKTEFYEEITGWNNHWTDISTKLKGEADYWRRYQNKDKRVSTNMIAATLAVERACGFIGLNFENTIATIHMYADRNQAVHKDIMELVEDGDFGTLAQVLSQDLRDLPVVTPDKFKSEIPIVKSIIMAIADQYYLHGADVPYYRWRTKDSAYDKSEELRRESEKKAAAVRAERDKIERAAADKFRKTVSDHQFAHLAAYLSKEPPPTGGLPMALKPGTKRYLPTDKRQVKLDKYKEQMKAWNKLIRLGQHCQLTTKEYVNSFGSVEPPIHPDDIPVLLSYDEPAAGESGSGPTHAETVAGPIMAASSPLDTRAVL